MDQIPQELTFEESIKQVMKTLPSPIRNYLAQGRYSTAVKNLMFKYQLRVDQGGVLEREIMLLIMGIENPDEFTQALVEEAKLDQKTVDSIVQDVNEQIFVPLREEMKNVGTVAPEPARPVMPQARPQVSTPPAPPRHIINKIQTPENKTQHPMIGEKLLEDHEEPSPSLKAAEGAAHIEFAKPATPPPSPRLVPPPTPLARPYASDPYREPVDEK